MNKKSFFHTEEIDFTTDHLFKKMCLFVIPVILTSVLQLLYSSSDLFVVAHFGGGAYAMTAVGDNGSLINLIVNTFVAVSVGVSVLVGEAKGEKDPLKANKIICSSFVIALFLGIIIAIIGYFCAGYFLTWIHTPTEGNVLGMATQYLQIYFLGVPFIMIFNFGAAALRSLGDSKRPLYALAICGLINLGLNFLFVMAFKLGVRGVAITTVICEALESILVLLFLYDKRKKSSLTFPKGKNNFDIALGKRVLFHGFPSGAETLIFSISNVLIQAQANLMGASVMAGSTASDNIEGYIYAVLEAFAIAVSSIASQNLGAGNKENLVKTLKYSVRSILVLGVFLGGLGALLRTPLISLFVVDSGSSDFSYSLAMEIGTNRLLLMGLASWICALMDCLNGYYRGLEHPIAPTVVTFLCACVFRIIYVYALYKNIPAMTGNFYWLYAAYPFSWVLADVTDLILLPRIRKKTFDKMDKKLALTPRKESA